MPNYVKNIVKMNGIASLPLFTEMDGQKRFSFDTIIPKPKELDIESGSTETWALEALFAKLLSIAGQHFMDVRPGASFPGKAELEEKAKKCDKTLVELEVLGLQYASNLVKHGATTWYDWCVDNWGTKWDAMETEIIDDDTVSFWTAWSNPDPIIYELARRYPDRLIEHWWADEDVGNNAGYRWLENGGCCEAFYGCGEQDALETYVKCWGEDDDILYRGDDGLLHYRSEEEDDE